MVAIDVSQPPSCSRGARDTVAFGVVIAGPAPLGRLLLGPVGPGSGAPIVLVDLGAVRLSTGGRINLNVAVPGWLLFRVDLVNAVPLLPAGNMSHSTGCGTPR